MRKLMLSVCFTLMALLAACGGSDEPAGLPPAAGGGAASAPVAANYTGTIMGKIAYEGTPPAMKKIPTSGADPKCTEEVMTENVKVSDGGLEDVIVYISGGLEGKSFPVPTEVVTLDQHGCHYVPHAITLQVGQTLNMKNSDMTGHNIHVWAEKNSPVNASEVGPMEIPHKFDKEEMPMRISCEVHKWMQAWAGVFTHPFHTVSKKGGEFVIKVPAGKYEVTAWHEDYKDAPQKSTIEVTEGGMGHVNFTFKAAATEKKSE